MTDSIEQSSAIGFLAAALARTELIRRTALAGIAVSAAVLLTVEAPYRSAVRVVLAGAADAQATSLRTLAGQLGVGSSSTSAAASPDFVAELMMSRAVLTTIADDSTSAATSELWSAFEKSQPDPTKRPRLVRHLEEAVQATVVRRTGVIEIQTRAPTASAASGMAGAVVSSAEQFLQQMRYSEAEAEVEFLAARLAEATASLRRQEDRLSRFRTVNRALAGSPDLQLQQQQMQRDVDLESRLVLGLAQALDDARMRSARRTPILLVIEAPETPGGRNYGSVLLAATALVLATILMSLAVAIFAEMLASVRASDPESSMRLQRAIARLIPSRTRVRSDERRS